MSEWIAGRLKILSRHAEAEDLERSAYGGLGYAKARGYLVRRQVWSPGDNLEYDAANSALLGLEVPLTFHAMRPPSRP